MPFICVVCRDKLTLQYEDGQIQIITSTECGHLFHQDCLKEHFEMRHTLLLQSSGKTDLSESCPQCQRVVHQANNRQIFPSEIEDADSEDRCLRDENQNLQEEIFVLKGRLRNLEMRLNAPNSSKHSILESTQSNEFAASYNLDPSIVPMESTEYGLLKLGDLVVWFGADGDSHDGVVKWIGTINNEIYTGVEFEDSIGNDFPEVDGRRLFSCAPFRGRLVRTRELLLQADFYGE